MDIKNIKKIIELMKENELCEFEMEEQGFRLGIKRQQGGAPHVMMSPMAAPHMMIGHPAQMAAPVAAAAPTPEAAPVADTGKTINSPIVGTFYRSPSPDAEPFVSIGQEVHPETVVCIIEAMKVMNEIKAETRGIIRKILVENATPVQFGQPLFQIDPL